MQMQMQSGWEQVTPDLAADWLTHRHPGNRPLSQATVRKYTRDMEQGHFNSQSPQGIIWDEDGYLTDGQHRLSAIVKTGLTYELWVTRGAPRETMETLDLGSGRTTAQRLKMSGVANGTTVAAIARFDIIWEAKQFWNRGMNPSHPEIIAAITASPRIVNAASHGMLWSGGGLMTARQAGFCWLLFDKKAGETLADEFMNAVRLGVNLPDGDQRLILRERLRRDQIAWKHVTRQRESEVKVLLTIQAWNAWRRHRVLTRLQLPSVITDGNLPQPV